MDTIIHSDAGGSVLVVVLPSLHRQGLLSTLHDSWPALSVSVTADSNQLPALVRQQSYALLVLDGSLHGPQLPGLLQQLRSIRSSQSTLVLTGLRPAARLRQQLLQAGASALLTYAAAPATVVATVAGLLSSTAHSISTAPASPRRSAPPTPFSQREVEVLRLVMADCCNQEIADRLFLSVRTIESHRRALLQKAGAKTLIGLVVQAMREGWVAVT